MINKSCLFTTDSFVANNQHASQLLESAPSTAERSLSKEVKKIICVGC